MRKNMQGMVLAVVLAAGFGGLAGCASGDRSSGQVVDDMLLSRRVSGALDDSPIYKFKDVDVKAYNGVVQLSGWATASEQKRKAEEIAKNVRGVREVVNNITVKSEVSGMRTTPPSSGSPGSQQEQIRQENQNTPQPSQQLQEENRRQDELRRQQLTP
jgi:hypothetical protein